MTPECMAEGVSVDHIPPLNDGRDRLPCVFLCLGSSCTNRSDGNGQLTRRSVPEVA